MTKWCSAPRFATATNSTRRSGLESEGIAVDFQVGVNDYLYGTRFFSYLALTYGPEKVVEWLRRDEGSTGFLRDPVPAACSASRSTTSGTNGSRCEKDFQTGQSGQAVRPIR